MSKNSFKSIKQAVSEESLFNVLSQWCKHGAGQKNWELQILTAFVSGNAIRSLEPLLDVYLADGNKVEIIFGIDRNGTDRSAIRRLFDLSTAYPGQAVVKLFHAPARSSIFHPKLYILRKQNSLSSVIGSSNLTLSGLGSNLESLILCNDLELSNVLATELTSIWKTFSEPVLPLQPKFLQQLTKALLSRLLKTLPERSQEDRSKSSEEEWQPLSRIKLPRSRIPCGRRPMPRIANAYMIYEIMGETRSTQMQIPLGVVEQFFGVVRDAPAELEISIITGNSLSQPIVRPLVISKGKKAGRLMRRLEMPTIRKLERPLTSMFFKLENPRSFAYVLFPNGTKHHRLTNSLLQKHGQQGGHERRYYIGQPKDVLWKHVCSIIGNKEQ